MPLAVVAGLALDLSFPGTAWWPLAFVGVAAPREVVNAVDEAQRRAGIAPPV